MLEGESTAPRAPRARGGGLFRRGSAAGGDPLAGGGGDRFARLALHWLRALASSLDVVLISEHYDASLLLLAKRLGN